MLMDKVINFFRFLLKHKWKIVFTLFCSIFFLIILFPFNDLNELVTGEVAKATQNRVYLQFDEMNLNPFGPTLNLEKVTVETPQTPTLNIDEIKASPSVLSLIQRKVGGEVSVIGFLKGQLRIKASPAGKTETGQDKTKIELTGQKLSLKDIRELASLPVALSGQLVLNTTAITDLTFSEQPEADLNLVIDRFEMPSSSVSLGDMGKINVPEVKLSQVELKGKLNNGKFTIESGRLGNAKDEFFGTIRGSLGLSFINMNGQVVPNFSTYDLNIDLKANSQFKERAKFFLSFLDGYKTEQADGSQYKFRLQGTAFGGAPQFTPLQ